jgi:DNA-binding MurR/RpiR family transcriptional regulator
VAPAPTRPDAEEADSYTLERIRSVSRSLAPSELRVARTILEHPFEALEWSAADLAKHSGTSAATAVRACRHLGFNGLRDLRLTLARDLGWPSMTDPAKQANGSRSVIHELFEDASRSLAGMLTKDTVRAFKRAAGYLATAEKILVVSVGPTQVFAQDFAFGARMLGRMTEFSPDAIMQSVMARQLTRKDVCLAVSASGANALTIHAAEDARSTGAKVVAVTGFQQSPLVQLATVSVVVDTFDYSSKTQAAVNSAGMLLMLRGLLIAMTTQTSEQSADSSAALRDAMRSAGGYLYRRPIITT